MGASIPILTFHRVDASASVISFPPQLFADGLRRLRDLGYRSFSLGQTVECLSRQEPFPDKAFVVTFDDGFESVYTEAFPVLQELGWSATVFLVAGETDQLPWFEGRPRLSRRQALEMSRHGISFGAHTISHPDLTRLPVERVEDEICRSKDVIEQTLGETVSAFAYPFGAIDRASREVVRRHFECACTDRLGIADARSDLWALPRVESYYFRTQRLFAYLSSPGLSLYVRARHIPRQFRRTMMRHGMSRR